MPPDGAVIGLDARMVGPVPTGLGAYASSLIRALTRVDTTYQYVVIRRPDVSPIVAPGGHVSEVVVTGDLDQPPNLARGSAISRLGLDLYHSLHHFLPLGIRGPRIVVTLHDLIWIEHRRLIRNGALAPITTTATHWFARAAMGYAMRHADHVVAVSSATRDRALAYYGMKPSCVTAIPHGVDHVAFRPFDSAQARRAPSARRPYFLCIGNTRPYKNIATAIRAFAEIAKTQPDLQLIITGRGDSASSLRRLVHRLDLDARVQFSGIVDHARLIELLSSALALVFPSIVEGFGFPVLEAMAAGCPVICSRAPSLAEIAGDAALLCDAAQPGEFAAAMTRLASDDALRAALSERGRVRSEAFTWDASARRTLEIYDGVLSGRLSRSGCAS